jgi:hypothetical protein
MEKLEQLQQTHKSYSSRITSKQSRFRAHGGLRECVGALCNQAIKGPNSTKLCIEPQRLGMSIEQFFKQISTQKLDISDAPSMRPPTGSRAIVDGTIAYIEAIKKSIDANEINLVGNPIVKPTCPFVAAANLNDVRQRSGESLLTERNLAALTLRPEVFAWVPENIFPGVHMKCPACQVRRWVKGPSKKIDE